jgi:RNA polymerase sigma-70 factor (ECF subfamily)
MMPIDHAPPARSSDGSGEPLLEKPWLEPYPDDRLGLEDGYAAPDARYEQREAIELAFVAAIQHLPARQRAVLLLREVLGFSAREVASALDTTAAAVNSALQRAHKRVDERVPPRSQQAGLRALGDERGRDLVRRYVDATAKRDIDALVALLVEDATFAMPPYPHWWRGRDDVVAFVASTGRPDVRHVVTRANGQPAVGWYVWQPDGGIYAPASIEVLGIEGERIGAITAFAEPRLFARFGLPLELAR